MLRTLALPFLRLPFSWLAGLERPVTQRLIRGALVGGWAVLGVMTASAETIPDRLRIGVLVAPTSLAPWDTSFLGSWYALGFAMRPVGGYDATMGYTCRLCVRVPSVENGLVKIVTAPDGRLSTDVTWELRRDQKWGDGTPVTADDLLLRNEIDHRLGGNRDRVSVEVLDPYRYISHMPGKRLDIQLFEMPVPAHLERALVAVATDVAGYRAKSLYSTAPATPGLWMGPYRVTDFTPGKAVNYERNPAWAGPPPLFAHLTLTVYPDPAALQQALIDHQIDYAPGEIGLPYAAARQIEQRLAPDAEVVARQVQRLVWVLPNFDHPILARQPVRLALLRALDRARLAELQYDSRDLVADGLLSRQVEGYQPRNPALAYDPGAAAALLDQAGLPRGSDGLRHDESGAPIRLGLMIRPTDATLAPALVAAWRVIGLEVTPQVEETSAFIADLRHRHFDLALGPIYVPPVLPPARYVTRESIPVASDGFRGLNWSGYSSPAMDTVLSDLADARTFDDRRAIWSRFQTIYATDLPQLPLFWTVLATVTPTWLAGADPLPDSSPGSFWVEEWRRQ